MTDTQMGNEWHLTKPTDRTAYLLDKLAFAIDQAENALSDRRPIANSVFSDLRMRCNEVRESLPTHVVIRSA